MRRSSSTSLTARPPTARPAPRTSPPSPQRHGRNTRKPFGPPSADLQRSPVRLLPLRTLRFAAEIAILPHNVALAVREVAQASVRDRGYAGARRTQRSRSGRRHNAALASRGTPGRRALRAYSLVTGE